MLGQEIWEKNPVTIYQIDELMVALIQHQSDPHLRSVADLFDDSYSAISASLC